MSNENLTKLIEISDNLKWCDDVINRSGESYTFSIGIKSNDDYSVLNVPDWLKKHIVKTAEKYQEKLITDLDKIMEQK